MTSGSDKPDSSPKQRRRKSGDSSATPCEAPRPAPPAEIVDYLPPDRVEQVRLWVIEGNTEFNIVGAIRAQWPEADPRPLINRAMDELTKSATLDPASVRGWCFEATRDLYRKMTAIGDFAGALRAIKQILQMVGNE